MKLLAIDDSSITSLFLAGRKEGQPSIYYAAAALIDRYKFRGVPNEEALQSNKQIFENGMFEDTPINSFEVYNDGIIVRSGCPTERLDELLEDVTAWMQTELGLSRIITHKHGKAYESRVLVECNPKVMAPLDQLKSAMSLLAGEIEQATGRAGLKFMPAGMAYSVNDMDVGGMRPVPFRLERKAATDFSLNLFFSAAPLPTSAHLRLLEHLERSVS